MGDQMGRESYYQIRGEQPSGGSSLWGEPIIEMTIQALRHSDWNRINSQYSYSVTIKVFDFFAKSWGLNQMVHYPWISYRSQVCPFNQLSPF